MTEENPYMAQVGKSTLAQYARSVDATLARVLQADDRGDGPGMDRQLKEMLLLVAALHGELERSTALAVRLARSRKMTWDEIGKQLGVSRQAAYQRYGKAAAVKEPADARD
jgi:hypothetical protein